MDFSFEHAVQTQPIANKYKNIGVGGISMIAEGTP